jgi:hypothetical protein
MTQLDLDFKSGKGTGEIAEVLPPDAPRTLQQAFG